MLTLQIFFYVLSAAVVLTVVLPLFRKDHWTFRAFEFPRVQKFVLILASIVMGLWVMDYGRVYYFVILGVLLLCLAYCGYLIFPFTPLARKTLPGAKGTEKETIKLLISNVYQYNKQYEKLRKHIRQRDPDILLLVETDKKWMEALKEVTSSYSCKLEKPLDNTYGMLCYSRLKLKDAEFRYLVDEEFPSIRSRLVTAAGREIVFYGLHPPPPSPTEEAYSTKRDSELLIAADEIRNLEQPVIASGDLNDVAWSFTTNEFVKISELLDPRKGRGIFSTFHADHWLMRWPLDHIFCSSHFRLKKMKRLRSIGSDHFPVYVELALK